MRKLKHREGQRDLLMPQKKTTRTPSPDDNILTLLGQKILSFLLLLLLLISYFLLLQRNESECFYLIYGGVPARELLSGDQERRDSPPKRPPGGAQRTVRQMARWGGRVFPKESPFSWETHVIPQLRLLSFVLSKGLEVSGPFWKWVWARKMRKENLQHVQTSCLRCICLELLLVCLLF